MNDQRMVDVGSLRRAVALLSTVHPAVVADKLRAIIDGPGVEPVGEVVAFGANLHEVSWKNGKLPPLGTKLYLAAPSAPARAVPDNALGDLLAVIHGDGGHYVADHGLHKALVDALAVVQADRHKLATVQAVPDWQPIETAPTSPDWVIGLLPDGDVRRCVGDHRYWFDWHGFVVDKPTHWMPLSAAPKESTAQSVACPDEKEK